MTTRAFKWVRVVVVAAFFCGGIATASLRGFEGEHEGECDEPAAQRCDMCSCHLGHGSGCTYKHGTVCNGDSCSLHSSKDCHFVDMEGLQ